MTETEYVCEKCRESPVSPGADTCPHCGHEPSAGHWRWAKIDGVLAGLCFVTVVGSPVGLFLVWRALKHRKKRNATPAVVA